MRKLIFALSVASLALLALPSANASQQYHFTMHNETAVYAYFQVWDKSQVQPYKFCVPPRESASRTFKGPVIILDVLAFKDGCNGPSVGRATQKRKADETKDLSATFSGTPSNYKLRWG